MCLLPASVVVYLPLNILRKTGAFEDSREVHLMDVRTFPPFYHEVGFNSFSG